MRKYGVMVNFDFFLANVGSICISVVSGLSPNYLVHFVWFKWILFAGCSDYKLFAG